MKELISILASYSAKFIDKSDITTKLGISKVTLDTYINVLEQTYLIDTLSPWLKSDYERVNKQSKYSLSSILIFEEVKYSIILFILFSKSSSVKPLKEVI